ncbi:sensor histidine kinase [Paenibacillus sp. H1-7]|uniref:sensor histidine kinase n=1 Tax=Paenibacillus sp. H1-7 TaxID=2282849 RepID=UPI001EF8A89D|nr:HAMP domain-containing sensor histidine kinase [Paenibacillus sp. H1-7]ULL15756.1 sensor histidine kinase [Paenibacillus sp. H1-7]
MMFVLIGLWTIGLLLIVTDPKRRTTRWIASIAFTGGSGGLSAVIDDTLKPLFYDKGWLTEPVAKILIQIETTCSLICYYGLPYTFLMFTIVYHPNYAVWSSRKTWVPWALLVPVLLSFGFDPVKDDPIPYRYVTLWTTPYIMAGIAILVHATLKERNTFFRKHRILTTLAAAPTLFFALFTLYVLPTFFGLYEMWRYNSWLIGFTLAVILISSFRYGFMGLQISIQNQKLDYTLRAITSGTAILNHAIKNDVGKIRLFSEKIQSEADQPDPHQLRDDIRVIITASQHIYDMIYRIQGQTQDVELHPDNVHLDQLLEQCVATLLPAMNEIEVERDFRYTGTIWGDKAQLAEVFTNVLTNAVEAMPGGGLLTVKLTETKRNITVEIKDTGIGMDKKQLKQVFDPFYTTKGGKKFNFGLGMSYCYHVIQKHKGSMHIHSKPGEGTAVFINFSKKERGKR